MCWTTILNIYQERKLVVVVAVVVGWVQTKGNMDGEPVKRPWDSVVSDG